MPILEQVQNITKIKDRPTAIINRQTQCDKTNKVQSKGGRRIGTISIKNGSDKNITNIETQSHSKTFIDNNGQNLQSSSTGSIVTPFSENKGLTSIVIDGIIVQALVDTGAEVSCIDWFIFEKLDKNKHSLGPKQTLTHAGSGTIQTKGTADLVFTVANVPFTQTFNVCPQLSHQLILGLDFLKKNAAVISFKNNTLQLSHNQHVSAVELHSTSSKTYTATLLKDAEIPPKTHTLLPVKCKAKQNVTCLAEPVTMLASKYYLGGARCVVQLLNGKTTYQICNPTHNTVTLPQGTVIATLAEIHVANITNTADIEAPSHNISSLSSDTFPDEHYIAIAHDLGINLDKCDLSMEEKTQLLLFLGKYRHVFAKDASELPGTTKYFHTIHTGNAAPVRSYPYKQTPQTARETDKLVKGMLENNLIEPSQSVWSSPVVLVKKKNGDYRFAVDYRKLNLVTEDQFFVIPRFSEVVDSVAETKPKLFSTLDLASGFWQVPLDPETKHKTAFVTRNGVYEFNRLPFGLKNAPIAFSMLMNEVLRGINWKFALVFIDDIIIYSSSFQQHLYHLTQVFDRLAEANLKLQPPKCLFAMSKVPYLGHIISEHGIAPQPDKTSAVESFPVPTSKKELQSFLGLCNYYRRFVKDFAHIAAPLTNLLKKQVKFAWTNAAQIAFETLKSKLVAHPVLIFPDFEKPFTLYTDASDLAIGYILGQRDDKGMEHVIAYGGRSMNMAERRWGITDKEGLALIEGVRYFKHYLVGKPFTIYTDHSALKKLDLAKQTSGRRQRWYDYLQGFDFTIIHKPGRVHQNADALSRRAYTEHGSTEEPEPNTFPMTSALTLGNDLKEYKLSYTFTKQMSPTPLTHLNSLEKCLHSELEYSQVNSVKLLEDLTDIRPSEIRQQQLQDQDIAPFIHYLESKTLPKDPDQIVRVTRTAADYDLIDSVLYFRGYAPFGKGHREDRVIKQLMVPLALQNELLQAYHDSPLGAHQGFDRTYQRLKQKYWWPSMAKDVKTYIQCCDTCQRTKRQYHISKTPLQPLPTTERFQRIHMDFLGPLPTTTQGHKHILLIVDAFTKWPEAFPLKSAQASDVARIFYDEIICRYGAPSILTDRGQQFMSHLLAELCKLFQIQKISTTAYHPQTNSTAERMNSYILQCLRAYTNEFHNNWHEYLQSVMLSYRSTPATQSTQYTPHMLMFGKECNLPIDVALLTHENKLLSPNEHYQKLRTRMKLRSELAAKHLQVSQKSSKLRYDKTALEPTFKLGDHVLLKNNKTKKGLSPKLTTKYLGPYYIVDVNPNNTYQIRNCKTDNIRRGRIHANQLRKYHEQAQSEHNETTTLSVPQQEQPNSPSGDTDPNNSPTVPEQPQIVEKIHRATRPQNGQRWYYVRLKGQRGTKVVPADSIPRHLKEAFHLHKTVTGKVRKRKTRK